MKKCQEIYPPALQWGQITTCTKTGFFHRVHRNGIVAWQGSGLTDEEDDLFVRIQLGRPVVQDLLKSLPGGSESPYVLDLEEVPAPAASKPQKGSLDIIGSADLAVHLTRMDVDTILESLTTRETSLKRKKASPTQIARVWRARDKIVRALNVD